jgi:hypothetical protein
MTFSAIGSMYWSRSSAMSTRRRRGSLKVSRC